jgi:hypothetical protein
MHERSLGGLDYPHKSDRAKTVNMALPHLCRTAVAARATGKTPTLAANRLIGSTNPAIASRSQSRTAGSGQELVICLCWKHARDLIHYDA